MKSLVIWLLIVNFCRLVQLKPENLQPEINEVIRYIDYKIKTEIEQIKSENEKLKEKVANVVYNKRINEYEDRLEKSSGDVTIVNLLNEPMNNLLTLSSPRTCYDWKIMGFNTSGYYLIDPDGKGLAEPPFSVFCDMTLGYTFIHHDNEGQQNISSCSGASCYSKVVSYDAVDTQIEALIRISESCQQFIQIDCLESPLYDGNTALSWWQDRRNNKQTYWSGYTSDEMGCTCALTKSCANPSTSCNCDSGITDQWLSDSGYLSNGDHLPVSALHFGTVKNAKPLQMEYKLGPLRCYGRKSVSYPTSCQDIWTSGIYTSGYYTLGSPNDTRLVYCNMSKVSETPEAETTVISKNVLFYAELHDNITTNGIVVFSNVSVNIGNAYDATNGVFIAPYDGIYEFEFHGCSANVSKIHIHRNGVQVEYTSCRHYYAYYIAKSIILIQTAMLQLNTNDKVNVYSPQGVDIQHRDHLGVKTHFRGKIITAL